MKKLTSSVLLVVLSSTFAVANAQQKGNDTIPKNETAIGEVLITGALGIKKTKNEITSSQQQVSAKDLTEASSSNMAMALVGKVAGLQINNTNNSVNPSNRVVLRGNRSLYGSNEALVVIDNAVSTMNIYMQLPPEIVESVNVIKGPAGAALYGKEGGNGVIIVTTKRGTKSNKIAFSLKSSVEFSSVYKLPIMQSKYGQGIVDASYDPTDYNGTNWVPHENTSWGPSYADSGLGGQMLQVGLPQADGSFIHSKYQFNKDNIGKFFNTGILFQNGISMNVGGRDSYASLALNRLENNFIVDGDVLKRNSFLFKAGKQIDKFRIDGTFNFMDDQISQSGANFYGMLLQTPSNVEVKRYAKAGNEGHWTGYAWNPFWLKDALRSDSNTTTLTGNLALNYDFSDNISVSYTGNVISQGQVTESHTDAFNASNTSPWITDDPFYNGETLFTGFGKTPIVSSYNKSSTKLLRYYGDLMVNFKYSLTDDLKLKANIGNNITFLKADFSEVGGSNLQIPGWYHIKNVQNSTPWYSLSNGVNKERLVAFFGNLDLNFKDYLFLNATYRMEQSSKLSLRPAYTTNTLKNPWYKYYSAGISFVPTTAFPSIKSDVFNYMKISGAFTRTGNAANAIYSNDQIAVFPTGFPMGGNSSYLFNANGTDENIRPEFNNTIEGNVSLGFFKDRITIDGSVYQTKTIDLVSRVTYPASSGYGTMLGNVGDLKNNGFEIALGLTPIKTKDFEWNLKGAYSKYKSTVERLQEGADMLILQTTGNTIPGSIAAVVGYDAPMIVGTAYTRDDNGNIVVDDNGLPVVDAKPKILGKVNPDYTITFGTNIRYKNFNLSATGDYRTGNQFLSMTKNMLGFTGGLEKSADFDRSQGYIIPGSVQVVGGQYVTNTTPVNGVGDYEHVINYFTSNYQTDIAEEFLVDGTALKIREIALSYSLPKSLIANTFLTNVTVGVFARNPFVWYAKSNRNFGDPEAANTSGIAGGYQAVSQLPTMRTYGFNVNINF